ncbi:hypothetical protein CPB85DRAFT_1436715 [Mucidula mucida]|nr:hypothetical protein CPB85DRAFT_1436715 [Mucidula mucida]
MSDCKLFWLGPKPTDMLKPLNSTVPASQEAQQLIRENLESVLGAISKEETFETTFFAQLNLQDGVYLIPELTEMGIFTPVALCHVAYASFHRIYVSLLRTALGMDEYNENCYVFQCLMNYFGGVNNIYFDTGSYETCQHAKIQGVAGAARWLATIDLSEITLNYHTNHALHVRNRDQEDDDEVLMGLSLANASLASFATMTRFSSPLNLHECDADAQLLLESQLPAQRPITVLRRRNPYTQTTVYEAAPPQDCGLERAVGDIPLPYRLANSMRSVLFRANTSGLIPAFEECGILDAADFIQLQALLDAGELWQHILLRAVGLDREDVNCYRLLHLIGWPKDDTNGPSLDDSQNIWSETEDPVQLVPNTLDSRGTSPGPRNDKTALVGHCHIFWSTPRHKILTVNSEACKSHSAWWLVMPTPLSLNNSVIWLIESDLDESNSQYDTAPETFVEEDLTNKYPDPEVKGLICAFCNSDMFKHPPVQSVQAQGTSSVGGGTLYAVSRSDGTQYSTTDWSQASTSVLNKGAIAKAIRKHYKRPRTRDLYDLARSQA